MQQYEQKAVDAFLSGCNCAQAVLSAFCTPQQQQMALGLTSGMGGGMGGMRETCGAVLGMFLAAGLHLGHADVTDTAAKNETYALIRRLAEAFRAEEGTLTCRELLAKNEIRATEVASERTPAYYAQRPCARYVALAARLLQEELQQRNEP